MRTIQTIEVDRWSEPDEQGRVRHIGMAKTKEVFDELESHLKANDLLPDEYFLMSMDLPNELPNYAQAICHTNYGASEGIYIDISLVHYDKDGTRHFTNFATGKTLGETGDDFFRMSRIAAECSLMLNGRGQTYRQTNSEFVLTPEQADIVSETLNRPAEMEGTEQVSGEQGIAEKLFTMACSGDIEGLDIYYAITGSLDVVYHKFGHDHSLVMGAYRNDQWDTVKWLLKHGAKATAEEQAEMLTEDKRQEMRQIIQGGGIGLLHCADEDGPSMSM